MEHGAKITVAEGAVGEQSHGLPYASQTSLSAFLANSLAAILTRLSPGTVQRR